MAGVVVMKLRGEGERSEPVGGDLWDVPGQAHAVRALRDAVEHDHVGHAWAFCGPADVGQQALARSLAAAVNCDVAATGCGSCSSCSRTLRGAHPAYWEFAPTGANHRVGEVRDSWMHVASRTSSEGHAKVLRIIDADRMNESAANAFLKVLEEPPEHTIWILEVADPDELPDTILSRCRSVRVSPWDYETMARLAGGPPLNADRELAVRASMGTPSRLRTLLTEEGLADLKRHRRIPRELRERRQGFALVAAAELDQEMKRAVAAVEEETARELERLAEFNGGAPPRDLARHLEQRGARRKREARTIVGQTALDDLAGWYRDVLLVRCGGDPSDALHADDPAGLRADAEALSERALIRSLDALFLRREELEFNVQMSLAIEAVLLDLATVAMVG
jgi:DNA polymerase-3 subunit delta'